MLRAPISAISLFIFTPMTWCLSYGLCHVLLLVCLPAPSSRGDSFALLDFLFFVGYFIFFSVVSCVTPCDLRGLARGAEARPAVAGLSVAACRQSLPPMGNCVHPTGSPISCSTPVRVEFGTRVEYPPLISRCSSRRSVCWVSARLWLFPLMLGLVGVGRATALHRIRSFAPNSDS